MRTVKKHDERRNEILDVAEKLFYRKGYEQCTINDILIETAIAKGTFYHYFKSKEEVMDAVISRYIEMIKIRAEAILEREDLPIEAKLMNAFIAMQINDMVDDEMIDNLHRPENALLHQKILNQMIQLMSPILVKIIEEGIEKKAWKCRYPLQYMQIFLAAAFVLTDEGMFDVKTSDPMQVMAALISMLEKMLEVKEDSFIKMYLKDI